MCSAIFLIQKIKNNFKFRHIVLSAIILLVFFLYFFRIGQEGYSNPYYSAAVKSMLTGWHNFFFVSFDSQGYVSVDKPPLGLWIQTLSAFIFGFKGWALILPQFLSAVISIIVLYIIVKRTFGELAGLIASFALAVSPVLVAVSRTNNLDSIVIMFILLATWCLIIASERASLKYLILSVFFIGLAFNVKMFQAFMVLPAFYIAYFFFTSLEFKKKIKHLAIATFLLFIISFSWALAVDFTPTDERPYTGGSRGNSVIELIVGYNGLMRVLPPPPGAMNSGPPPMNGGNQPPGGLPPFDGGNPPPGTINGKPPPMNGGNQPPPGGPNPMHEVGRPGMFRLFSRQLAGQIIWLFPLALISIFVLLKVKEFEVNKKRQIILWAIWLVTMFIYFSISGFFHRYYLAMMAPPIAALTGAGLFEMGSVYFSKENSSLPYLLAITGIFQGFILTEYSGWAIPGAFIALLSFMGAICALNIKNTARKKAFLVFSISILFLAPFIWSMTPVIYGTDPRLPYAGPELSREENKIKPPFMEEIDNKKLIRFLKKNKTDEKFILAVPSSNFACDIILETDEAVMAIGGFAGADRILTIERLENMVNQKEIRFFLLAETPEMPEMPIPSFGNKGVTLKEVSQWVKDHGKLVPAGEWKASSADNKVPERGPQVKLYDLENKNNYNKNQKSLAELSEK